MLGTSPRLGEFRFGKSDEWNSRWTDFTVVRELSRAFITCPRNGSAPASIADEIIYDFDGFVIFTSFNQIVQVENGPWAHPDFRGPATGCAHLVVRIELRLIYEHADLALDDLL